MTGCGGEAERPFDAGSIAHHEAGHALVFECRALKPSKLVPDGLPWEVLRVWQETAGHFSGGLKSLRNFVEARDEVLQGLAGLAAESIYLLPEATSDDRAAVIVDQWLPFDGSNDAHEIISFASVGFDAEHPFSNLTPQQRDYLLVEAREAIALVLSNDVRWRALAGRVLESLRDGDGNAATLRYEPDSS